MQFCCQLRASGASPDDGDVKLAGPHRRILALRANAGIYQPAVEARGLFRGFQRYRKFLGARRSKNRW